MNIYLKKAKERLQLAKIAIETGYWCGAASNCYFAFFHTLQSVLGESPDGKWKHRGIVRYFAKVCRNRGLFSPDTLEKIFELDSDLYELRRLSDYQPVDLTEEADLIRLLVEQVETLLREVEDELGEA